MNLDTFRKIEHINKQLIDLQNYRDQIYNTAKSPSLIDTGKPSSLSDPVQAAFKKLEDTDQQISDLITEKADLMDAALDWMYSHSDPVPVDIRILLINKYILSLSWDQAGKKVGRNGGAARHAVYRYMNKGKG